MNGGQGHAQGDLEQVGQADGGQTHFAFLQVAQHVQGELPQILHLVDGQLIFRWPFLLHVEHLFPHSVVVQDFMFIALLQTGQSLSGQFRSFL
tara:strand:- start:53 stop:331 length:279 start_codon:yes stop_codon:yes gene_type:complete